MDSLSVFSQGTMQMDLYLKLISDFEPFNHEAYMGRSVPYNKRGEHATGFAMLNKAVELAPKEHLGYRAFVKLYMMHDYEGALRDCLRLDSLTAFAKPGVWGEEMDVVIGLCYLQLGDYKTAKTRISASIKDITRKHGKQWNPSRSFLYLGIALMKDKQYAEAIRTFDELIHVNATYSEAYYYKALCLEAINDHKKAETTLQKCRQVFEKHGAERNPYFEMPYQLYGSMLRKDG